MFLSMVATPSNAAALSGLPFEQRFNVAASRARERMILVRSIELDQLSPSDKLRRALLEHFRSPFRSEEHTSELQSLMRISYDVFCLQKKHKHSTNNHYNKNQNK